MEAARGYAKEERSMPIPGRLGLCFGPLLPSILSPLFLLAGQKKKPGLA